MLWVDKYRPKTLDQAIVHQDIAQNLKKLVAEQDCSHLLFYGPSGSGKKTLIIALLRQVFGPSADKVKVENRTWRVDMRQKLYELLLNFIPPQFILKRLLYESLKKLDAELKHEEHRMRLRQKAIFRLEAFMAKFMSIYKAFLVEAFG